ncbi:MAG: TadE/TadG family type IV pilus assembly protein [Gemmataceae bacterium]
MRCRLGLGWHARQGAAAVEFALVLPLIALCLVASVDFARLYYHYCIVTNCARNGALYASDPTTMSESPYGSLNAAALADASNLSPAPSVNSQSGTDGAGNPYVEVTVVYPFTTISNYPGLSNPINLSRTVRMRSAPASPN